MTDDSFPQYSFHMRDLRRLPLDAHHRDAGAHFGQIFGWERPLYFGKTAEPKMRFDQPDWFENVRAEVQAAHEGAAIFDLSPFDKIDVTGPDAEAFLMHTCAGHVNRAPGSVIYSAVLNQRGTFESDITAQRLAADHYRLFVGTGAIRRDLAWFARAAAGFDVTLTDVTEDWAVLALMGPRASRVAAELGDETLLQIGYFRHEPAIFAGCDVRAARLSYVGEAGWEITCRVGDAPILYAAMTEAGAVPAGLFAQTSMRIEKGFCAMGHELDGDLTPVDVGLDVGTRNSGGFTGAEALAARRSNGDVNRLVSLTFEDDEAVPIGREPICRNGVILGQTTSCAYGYRIGKPVALGLVRDALVDASMVEVDIAGTMFAAQVTVGPLFDPKGERMRG